MPRPTLPPRLRLREYRGARVWVIKDGKKNLRTGCYEDNLKGAEEKLKEYLTDKLEPLTGKKPGTISCAEILRYYTRHRLPRIANAKNEVYLLKALERFWSEKHLIDVDRPNCRAYTSQRLTEGVSGATARRELETLRAAVNLYLEERKVVYHPSYELPEKSDARLRWLTRTEAAQLLHAARRRGNHHIARIILIGIYTGTRVGAICSLRWTASSSSGYIDLDQGVIFRKGYKERATKKRRPSIGIPARLMPHLARWRKIDGKCTHVINRFGEPIENIRKAWVNSRNDVTEIDPATGEAKHPLGSDVSPHTLRHTAASWGIQNVQNVQDLNALADYLGMTLDILLSTYGHLNPIHHNAATNAISRRPGSLFAE
ncbi:MULTISPECIES: site-specific integrase [unclassified Roseibium]|uniref:tyrosine-type recombinase/integrase n=1 Tax=unclassified Roseibium TaxID=2629323 RepID=UPI00273DEAC9|nr:MULTISPECIES: site-specific integrase [unclassified Roseibium]